MDGCQTHGWLFYVLCITFQEPCLRVRYCYYSARGQNPSQSAAAPLLTQVDMQSALHTQNGWPKIPNRPFIIYAGSFDVKSIARPNILSLEPYRCARDDYSDGVLLDANENAFGPGLDAKVEETKMELHRYPDPLHLDIKAKVIPLGQNLCFFPSSTSPCSWSFIHTSCRQFALKLSHWILIGTILLVLQVPWWRH